MRNRFDRQLAELNEMLTDMGSMIEESIAAAARAVVSCDVDEAKRVMERDDEINHAERDVENLCFKLLLQQQPVARDLRQISAALKMVTDMERIGDQSSDICEILIRSDSLKNSQIPGYIRTMAEETIFMVTTAVEAYVKKDRSMAEMVVNYDIKVDNLFNQIKADIIDGIRKSTHGDEQAIDILMIAKYLEKIGDHAENIAKWVVFSITGEHFEK